jgi:hypothetical protein
LPRGTGRTHRVRVRAVRHRAPSAADYQDVQFNVCEGNKPFEETRGCTQWGKHVTGYDNTALGAAMMENLTSGSWNTALGVFAQAFNREGSGNTAVGTFALEETNATDNNAFGTAALRDDTSGAGNDANGYSALEQNKTGSYNQAIGTAALYNNISGIGNLAFGYRALYNSTGSDNIALGFLAGRNLTTGSHNIDIENEGVGAEEGTTRIGHEGAQTRAYVAGVYKKAVGASACAAQVSAEGQLGCNSEGSSGAVATFTSIKEVPSGNCLDYSGVAKVGTGVCAAKTSGFSTSPRLAPMPANGGTVADLYADSSANVAGTDTVIVAVIDNTTGATLLSCTVTSSSPHSCSNSSEIASAGAGDNVEVEVTANGESGNKKAWRVTFRF